MSAPSNCTTAATTATTSTPSSTTATITAPPSTAAQSTAAQSTAAQSTAAQSTAFQSTAAQSTAPQSTAAQSTDAQSTAPQSTAVQSTTTKKPPNKNNHRSSKPGRSVKYSHIDPYVVLVSLQVHPDRLDEFMEIVHHDKQESLKEPGVLSFQVIRADGERPTICRFRRDGSVAQRGRVRLENDFRDFPENEKQFRENAAAREYETSRDDARDGSDSRVVSSGKDDGKSSLRFACPLLDIEPVSPIVKKKRRNKEIVCGNEKKELSIISKFFFILMVFCAV